MFEQMIAENMKMNTKNTYREDECIDAYMKPVQFRPSFNRPCFTRTG